MSRRHTTTTSTRQRQSAPPAPTPAGVEGGGTVVATDLPFRLAVDRLLAEMSTEGRSDALGNEPSGSAPAPEGPISTTVPVAGMTCRSCEVRIQKYVGRLPNVKRVNASAVHGRVEIESTAPIPAAAIAKAIRAAGYEIGRTPWLASDPKVWLTAVAGVALVAAVAMLAQLTGVTGLANGAGDLSKGGLVVALLLGLAAGVSTCMALVGGLVLALSASFQARRRATGAAEGGVIVADATRPRLHDRPDRRLRRARSRARGPGCQRHDAAPGHGRPDDHRRDRDDDPRDPAHGPVAADRDLVADAPRGTRASARAR